MAGKARPKVGYARIPFQLDLMIKSRISWEVLDKMILQGKIILLTNFNIYDVDALFMYGVDF